jgi:mono/diheme cytochrome c family protein
MKKVMIVLAAILLLPLTNFAAENFEPDHKGIIEKWSEESLQRGQKVYEALCVICHGTDKKEGSLPTALKFHSGQFKNGSDAHGMYKTLTKGFGMMLPQNQFSAKQKYDVIHYIQETFVKQNKSQYKKINDGYLSQLPKSTGKEVVKKLGKPYLDMNYGPFLFWTYQVDKNNISYKSMAVRLDQGEGGVSKGNSWMLFDHDIMGTAAGWTGKFIDWNHIGFNGRHGVHTSIMREKGKGGAISFANPYAPAWANPQTGSFKDPRFRGRDKKPYGPLPKEWAQYKGLYKFGDKIVYIYTVGSTKISEKMDLVVKDVFSRDLNLGPAKKKLVHRIAPEHVSVALATGSAGSLSKKDGFTFLTIPPSNSPQRIKILISNKTMKDLTAIAKLSAVEDLAPMMKGGSSSWTETVTTKIKTSSDSKSAYVVDNLQVPEKNPYGSWMRMTGFDFYKNPDKAAISTWMGDVWIVTGLTGKTLTWKRYATGMFQPLGIKVVNETVYVSCRDQLVRLHDLNGDDEADFYECFNNDHQVTEHFHEFAMGLQTDKEGNFYYAKSARHAKPALVAHHGTLLKVSKDGKTTEIIANGFRAANGVCVNDDGSFFVTDQEGHWTPKNRVNWVTKGGYYGNHMGYHNKTSTADSEMEPPLAWLTNKFNRSPGELVWVKSDKWGPLKGSLIDISYGMGRIFVVPHEKVNGQLQGGEVAMPIPDFVTGVMRGRFSPADGQLYTCGMFAWAGNKNHAGGFYRVRYTGKELNLPIKLKSHQDGISFTYSSRLNKSIAEEPANYEIKVWDIKRTRSYGSKHYNETKLKVTKATLGADGMTVKLVVEGLKPTWGMSVKTKLKSASGQAFSTELHNSIYNLGK